jgi:hypothetical protein
VKHHCTETKKFFLDVKTPFRHCASSLRLDLKVVFASLMQIIGTVYAQEGGALCLFIDDKTAIFLQSLKVRIYSAIGGLQYIQLTVAKSARNQWRTRWSELARTKIRVYLKKSRYSFISCGERIRGVRLHIQAVDANLDV